MSRRFAGILAVVLFAALAGLALAAPEHLSDIHDELKLASPSVLPPFGADQRGRPLLEYAEQGARVVLAPSLLAGCFVGATGVVGGLLRCVGSGRADAAVQAFSEVVGSLPRMVVILVVALALPSGTRGLLPLAFAWAVLASPGAMDEAAAVAERLGGARFVEALRAHGFGWGRVFLYHVVALNLRPVVVRQGAEVVMQVTFLELGLSYLASVENQSSFTHADSAHSWADLLRIGYPSLLPLDVPSFHALALGVGLVAVVTAMSMFGAHAARGR